ncbi:MAG: MotA/TolQ/ExbB proton channel family protein [Myxococcales bacterium]|nr:MAG: MotA/TolQ/ExbB proton channel family protein [Myxococcales bacterium]
MWESMWSWFDKGGAVMYPIALCAVLAATVFFERMWSLRRERIIPVRLIKAVDNLVREQKFSEAGVLCEQDRSAVSVVLLTGLRHVGKTRDIVKERMEETGKSVAADLERFVNVLGTVAAVSPLLGLLGTVTGMIDVFQKVTSQGVGDPRYLASGIWEALITTAAGLIVAIPTYVIYRYFLSRVDRFILEMEEAALDLAEAVGREG